MLPYGRKHAIMDVFNLCAGIIVCILISVNKSTQHSLSIKRVQAANHLKTKYKIPPPVSGKVFPPQFVELLIVVHWDVLRYHGEDTIGYITMVLNQAAGLWSNVGDLGVDISLSVKKLVMLEDDQNGALPVMADAIAVLRKFCTWREQLESHQLVKYDAALLITRNDLHIANNYNATGVAFVMGACHADQGCAVVEDSSPMGTAITVTHEIGHLLGMYHDSQFNACPDSTNIMSGFTVSGMASVRWSTCSTESLLEFIRTARSACLKDPPSHSSQPLDAASFPGDVYGGDAQCRIAFGVGAKSCPTGRRKRISCLHLKCLLPRQEKCVPTNRPPLDGTRCAMNKWCSRGSCVTRPSGSHRPARKLVAQETSTARIMGDTPTMETTQSPHPLMHLPNG